MKIRKGFVSNSSSSSFVIAYDKSFFGDLKKFFRSSEFGCETCVIEEKEDFFEDSYISDSNRNKINERLEQLKDSGKTVIYLKLDDQCQDLMKLFTQINQQNGSDKMEIVFGNE